MTVGVDLGTGLGAYGRFLRHGPAARPFVFAALARLTLAMVPLGILILVEHERHAYGIAGVVSGGYALGAAVGTPVWGRLMDRFGQVAVLVPTSVISAALLVGLALATTGGAPNLALIAIAAGVGLSYPAISPALRSSFRIVLPDPQDRRVAFALDATSVELAFVCGPLLLSALLLPGVPMLPLLVTAGLLAGGGLAYCATGVARRATGAVQRAAAGHDPKSTGTGPADRPGRQWRGGRSRGDADAEHRLRAPRHLDGGDRGPGAGGHGAGGDPLRRDRGRQHRRRARVRCPALALRRAPRRADPARHLRVVPRLVGWAADAWAR